MSKSKKLIALGFVIEILAIVFLSYINPSIIKLSLNHELVSIMLFSITLIGSLLINYRERTNYVSNGALVGVVMILTYIVITVSAELAGVYQNTYDLEYWVKHLAKVAGGICGGLVFVLFRKNRLKEVEADNIS
ncbi:hypothetical protein [Pseudoalteromonas piscicida]